MKSIINYKSYASLLICVAATFSLAGGNQFHVSPEGNDSNRGSLEDPFRTIERAMEAIRDLNRDKMNSVTVFLHGGKYHIGKTLEFNSQDGGRPGFSVTYRSFDNEVPIISGGIELSQWKSNGNGVWTHHVPEGLNFRQLYVNGIKAIRSRHPNADDYYKSINWDYQDKTLHLFNHQVEKWEQFEKIELVTQWSWVSAYLRLKSFKRNWEPEGKVDRSYTKLHFNEVDADIAFNQPYPEKLPGAAFHFENAFEFVDQPGEWYLDTVTNTLYYIARPWDCLETAVAVVPVVETLLKIVGDIANPVQNLVFYGIHFMHSTWMHASEHGHLETQSGQYIIKSDMDNNQYANRPAAAVYVNGARGIRFERCVFRNLGACGIDFHMGVKDSSIIGNVFQEIAASGISLGEFSSNGKEIHEIYNPSDELELTGNLSISNNIVKQVAGDYYGCVGITAGFIRDTVIEHNEISHLPYTGISVGWGWTKEDNAMRNNMIARNHIHNVMQLLEDGGAIYTISKQPGSHIFANYIHSIRPSDWIVRPIVRGIYLDEGSSGITVERNQLDGWGYEKFRTHMTGEIRLVDEGGHWQDVRDAAGITKQFSEIRQLVR